MKKLQYFLLLLITLIFFTSCSDMLNSLNNAVVPTPQVPTTTEETTESEEEADQETEPEPQPVTTITYTVRHHKQNVNNDEYTLVENATETKLLSPIQSDAEIPSNLPKTYTGFHTGSKHLDSNNVINIYYARNVSVYTFNANGGAWTDGSTTKNVNGKYEAVVTCTTPQRSGYEFVGWAQTSNATTSEFPVNPTITVTSSDSASITLYAIWIQTQASGTLTFITGIEVQIVADGTSAFIAQTSVQGTYTYEWYLNNTLQSTSTSSFNISSLASGYYELYVKVTDSNGFVYIASRNFTK